MPAFLLALIAATAGPVTLERGGTSADPTLRYWAVQDTFLDSHRPRENFGRDPLLSGGQGKTILIDFRDLRQQIPAHHSVSAARLMLTQVIGETPVLAAASAITHPWGEGAGRRGVTFLAQTELPSEIGPIGAATWVARWGGTPGSKWDREGARGAADRIPLEGISIVRDGTTVILDGLGPAIQQALERPTERFGLALEFKNAVDFTSSEAPSGKPRLVLETSPADRSGADVAVTGLHNELPAKQPWPAAGTKVTWTAEVRAKGANAGYRIEWFLNEKPVGSDTGTPLADGTTREHTLELPWPAIGSDPRLHRLTVRVSAANDPAPWNDAISAPMASLPVSFWVDRAAEGALNTLATKQGFSSGADLAAHWVTQFNETFLAHSRFSFAPSGARAALRLAGYSVADLATVRLTSSAILIPSVDNLSEREVMRQLLRAVGAPMTEPGLGVSYPGLGGVGDTRNESDFPADLGFLADSWFDPITQELKAPPTDLLGSTEVAFLQALTKNPAAQPTDLLPAGLLFRFLDGAGLVFKNDPRDKMTLTLKDPATNQVLASHEIPNGTWRFPGKTSELIKGLDTDPWNRSVIFEVTRYGETASSLVHSWQLLDAGARSSTGVAILPVRFPLPQGPVQRQSNLVTNRIVTSSFAAQPAALLPLLDGDPATEMEIPAKTQAWIEIDLGKERSLGEVEMICSTFERLAIKVANTGQASTAARTWAVEPDGRHVPVFKARAVEGSSNRQRIRYHGPLTEARILRLEIQTGDQPLALSDIRAYPVVFQQ